MDRFEAVLAKIRRQKDMAGELGGSQFHVNLAANTVKLGGSVSQGRK
jgi:hypothetical protein